MNGPVRLIVMGVSGAEETTIATEVSRAMGIAFVDADSLHPAGNVEKMRSGSPLTDQDRWPWLDRVGQELADRQDGLVIACSALRRIYRDRLRARAPDVRFVQLDGTSELLIERLRERRGHYMPPSLLGSQLQTLERLEDDEVGVRISAVQPVAAIVDLTITYLKLGERGRGEGTPLSPPLLDPPDRSNSGSDPQVRASPGGDMF